LVKINLCGDEWGLVVAGTELNEIQRQIDNLPLKRDPQSVSQLLSLRRDVLFLEFDVAVRHSVRDTFLATGNIPAYKVLLSLTVCDFFSCFVVMGTGLLFVVHFLLFALVRQWNLFLGILLDWLFLGLLN